MISCHSYTYFFSDALLINDKKGEHWLKECLLHLTPATHIPNALFSNFTVEMFKNIDYNHVFYGRKAIYFGPVTYSYGYTVHKANPIPATPGPINEIYNLTNSVFNNHFNSLMIQLYENGESYIPSHSDDAPGIAATSVILSLSLGQARMFVVSSKTDANARFKFRLKHGDILLMSQHSQLFFKHEIKPSSSSLSTRISLTFRKMTIP